MVETVREIERKYQTPGGTPPDLSGIPGVASVVDRGVVSLDAVYYDTSDERLAADGVTLRRRTGGDDEGWHLKLPVDPATVPARSGSLHRDEVRAPLTRSVPHRLTSLVRSRVRDRTLAPVLRLRTDRDLRVLQDAAGRPLAEVSRDEVHAERLDGSGAVAAWTEIEVELASGAEPAFLDVVERHLGLARSDAASKLARALAETAPDGERTGPPHRADRLPPARVRRKAAAGDHVLAYLRTQVDALVELDPAVRLERPDAVHRMRVATRRLRSVLRSYRTVLDRSATDGIVEELRRLAAELGVDRDREVLTAHLREQVDALPPSLVVGPVRGRLRSWTSSRHTASRRHVTTVLDDPRHLALLDALDALLADPPLRSAAAKPPRKVLARAVLRDVDRLAARMDAAFAVPEGPERDLALHSARKAAKRVRYAAEAARPALGKPAAKFARRVKALQRILGDHQDSVIAREALRDLSAGASYTAGDNAFTFGVLYGREEERAAARERELPRVWRAAAHSKHRSAMRRH